MKPHRFRTSMPFTRAELLAGGLSISVLRGNEFVRVTRGVWAHAGSMDRLTLIRAALMLHPEGAFVSHLSAAIVLGLPVPEHRFAHITVRRPQDRRYRAEIKTHVTQRRRRLITRHGLPVTDPIATFIDCAGTLGLVDLVILGDALVKQYDVDPAKLVAACDASDDYYAGLARRAAGYVRAGVDSPMETRLRMLIVLAGLPEPVVNFRLYNDDGTWRRRFDLCYPSIKLIVEYDRWQHRNDSTQWASDIERREEFDDEGYRVLVVIAPDIFRSPQRTVHRVRRQLVLRGWPDVPEIDEAWREHFAA